MDDRHRFWSKVDKNVIWIDESDKFWDCWEWLGCCHDGYGRFELNGQNLMAYKVSYEWAYGKVPNSFELHHLCYNKRCVNPVHLEILTRNHHRSKGHNLCCRKGHLWTLESTEYNSQGKRRCKLCHRQYSYNYYYQHKGKHQ